MSQPVVEGSLGSPPFEKPNIEQVTLKKQQLVLKVLQYNGCQCKQAKTEGIQAYRFVRVGL